MPALVTIGGQEYEIPELNFLALERAWPFIDRSMSSLDPILAVSAGISVIAAGIMEAPYFKPEDFGVKEGEQLGDEQIFERVSKFLKKKLMAKEIENVRLTVVEISKEAGLEAEEGELLPPGTEDPVSPSTETAQSLLSSSSLPAVAAGIMNSSGGDTASESITS